MLSQAIYTILAADSDVAGVVGTKIFPSQAQAGKAYPMIVYHLISTAPSDTKDSGTEFDRRRVQVDCLAETYTDCEVLAGYVRTALDRSKNEETVSSVLIKLILFESEVDLNELAASVGADTEVFHRAVDFTFITG